MELYLGSIIEPIRKSIHNTLYFNSKHAPKTLGESMQKTQDLHIKHLYALGEDQQEPSTASLDILPDITVNEVTTCDNSGWYRNQREYSEYSQKFVGNTPTNKQLGQESDIQSTPQYKKLLQTANVVIIHGICRSGTNRQQKQKTTSHHNCYFTQQRLPQTFQKLTG